MGEDKNICENCSQEYEGEAQSCEKCGLDGLGACCIGELEHPCEDAEEEDEED